MIERRSGSFRPRLLIVLAVALLIVGAVVLFGVVSSALDEPDVSLAHVDGAILVTDDPR